MPFFETLTSAQNHSRDEWMRGVQDFHDLGPIGKAAAAGAGAGGALVGAIYAVPKTFGVTASEFWSQSFGATRGKTLFDYVTNAPVLQMAVTGAIAEGVGAALHHFHFVLPWAIVPTTFVWGALSYLSAQWFRYLPPVVGLSAHAAAGDAMHWVRSRVKPQAPEAPPPETATIIDNRSSQLYGLPIATRSALLRSATNQLPQRTAV